MVFGPVPNPHGREPEKVGAATAPLDPALFAELDRRSAAAVAQTWERLARPAPAGSSFAPSMVAGLPEPARRWLTHAIAPGTPLFRTAVLEFAGHIRLGGWLPFRAVQVHTPPDGYVWVTTRAAGRCRASGTWTESRSRPGCGSATSSAPTDGRAASLRATVTAAGFR